MQREIGYDRLVLATGSRVTTPPVDGAEHLLDVDTMPAAAALHAHIGRLAHRPDGEGRFTAVVVGAGFTGIEMATELPGRLRAAAGGDEVRVVLVERADVVGPELGSGPRPEVLAALEHAGVEVRLGVALASLTDDRAGTRDAIGRLEVDEYLRVVGVDGVYAAGDTAAA